MASIDEKIVALKLQNSQFISGIKSSLEAIKDLNKGLKLDDASKGLEGITKAAENVKLDSISQQAGLVTKSFNALEIAAGVALGNIASRAVMAGANLLKALTIKPVMDGFAEYELQMKSVQTILANTASKGETIETVNAALDRLNDYADLTIYNFGQMTSSIGMFTAAGVGLEESVAAIKGISNLAAISGSSAEQASTAMYQLSQAIASGTVRLIDWNSVQHAGMSGEVFQEALKRTARNHGIMVDEMIEKNGNFRESLQEGWLSSEIMLETLSQIAGEVSEETLRAQGYTEEEIAAIQDLAETATNAATEYKTLTDVIGGGAEILGSGWAQTFRIIIGDYEQAKELWTAVGNTITGAINAVAAARNELVQGWADLGGREALLGTLANLFNAILQPLKAIGGAFADVFSGPSAESLANFTKSLERVTSHLILSEENTQKLKEAFTGIFSVIKMFGTILTWVLKPLLALFGILVQLAWNVFSFFGTQLLRFVAWIGRGATAVSDFVSNLDPVGFMLELFLTLLGLVGAAFTKYLLPPLTEAKETLIAFGQAVKDHLGAAVDWLLPKLKMVGTIVAGAFVAPFALGYTAVKHLVDYLYGPAMSVVEWSREKFQAFRSIVMAAFAGETSNAATKFGNVVYDVASAIKFLLDQITLARDNIVAVFSGGTTDEANRFQEAVVTTATFVSDLVDKFTGLKDITPDAIDSSLATAVGAVGSAASTAATKAKPFTAVLQDMWSVAKNAFSGGSILPEFDTEGGFGHWQDLLFAITSIGDGVTPLKDSFAAIGDAMYGLASVGFDKLRESLSGLQPYLEPVKEWFATVFAKVRDSGGLEAAANAISKIGSAIKDVFKGGGDGGKTVGDWFANDLPEKIKSAIPRVKEALNSVKMAVTGFFSNLFEGVDINVGEAIQGFGLGAVVGTIILFFQQLKGGALSPFANVMETISSVGESFTGVLDAVKDRMKALTLEVQAKAILLIAAAILVLAVAIKLLASIPADKVKSSLIAFAAGIAAILAVMKALSSTTSPTGGAGQASSLMAMAVTMVGVGVAMLLIAGAVKKLGDLNTEQLIQGGAAAVIIIGVITVVAKSMQSIPTGMTQASGIANMLTMVGVAIALKLIANAIVKLGEAPIDVLYKGVAVAAIILVALAVFSRILNTSLQVGNAVSLLIVAFAVKKIADVLVDIGAYDFKTVMTGMAYMGSALLLIGLAMNLIGEDALWKAVLILAIAYTLRSIVGTLEEMSQMSWGSYVKAALMLGLVIAGMIVAVNAATGGLLGAAALLVMAVAVRVLAKALIALSAIEPKALAVAVLAVAAALAVLVGLGYLATGAVVGLLALSAAVLLLGVGLGAIGVAMMLVAVALAMIGAAGAVAVPVFLALAAGIIMLIPLLGAALAQAIVNFITILGESHEQIREAVSGLIQAGLLAITDNIPEFNTMLTTLILEGCETLRATAPTLIDTGWFLLKEFLRGFSDNIYEVTDLAVDIVVKFCDELGNRSEELAQAGIDLIIDLLDAISSAIDDNEQQLIDAGWDVVESIANAIWDACKAYWSKVFDWGYDLGTNIIDGLKSGITNNPIADTLTSAISPAIGAAKSLLGINSPSKLFRSFGQYTMQGFVLGVKDEESSVTDTMRNFGARVINATSEMLNGLDTERDLGISPTITPVLDLSTARRQAEQMELPTSMTTQPAYIQAAMVEKNAPSDPLGVGNGEPSVSITQNNYSPRELNTMEIHRRNKQLVSEMKDVLNRR